MGNLKEAAVIRALILAIVEAGISLRRSAKKVVLLDENFVEVSVISVEISEINYSDELVLSRSSFPE